MVYFGAWCYDLNIDLSNDMLLFLYRIFLHRSIRIYSCHMHVSIHD